MTGTTASPLIDVTYPESGETISGTVNLLFDLNDSGGGQDLTGFLGLSYTSGSDFDIEIATDVNYMTACSFPTDAALVTFTSPPSLTEASTKVVTVGSIDGNLNLIADGSSQWDSFYYDKGAWISNQEAINGLLISGEGATMFDIGATTYFVHGHGLVDGNYVRGYDWNGTGWARNHDIVQGLLQISDFGQSKAFTYGGDTYLISWQQSPDTDFNGYRWNGTSWDNYDFIVTGLKTIMDEAPPDRTASQIDYFVDEAGNLQAIIPEGAAGAAGTLHEVWGARFDTGTGSWQNDLNFATDINADAAQSVQNHVFRPAITSDYNNSTFIFIFETIGNSWNAYEYKTLAYKTRDTAACSFEWNTTDVNNGTYYLDANAVNAIGETGSDKGAASFNIYNVAGAEQPPEDVNARGHKVGIYVMANDYDMITNSATMHNWRSFSSTSTGTDPGRILIDNNAVDTCNFTWDCQTNLGTGSHRYTMYSSTGGLLYTGHFNVDLNSTLVKIYVPITYNLFDIYTDSSETFLVSCADIYSVNSAGDADEWSYLSTSFYVNGADIFLDSNDVMPRNCYNYPPYSQNPLFAYDLPGLDVGIEPLHIQYTDSTGGTDCNAACLFGSHFLGGYGGGTLTGTRSRQGYTNFYKLDAEEDFYPTSQTTWTGSVGQISPTVEDGYYSPITTVKTNMNIDSALYGDANYIPGDFGLGDNIYCEAKLHTHGYTAYDINMMLITDQNTIYEQFSFSPYKKYNPYLTEVTSNGAFDVIWHKFVDVDTTIDRSIQCAVQVKNELGFNSGWALSGLRMMYASNTSAAGGLGIYVKDEDGSISYLRHQSPSVSADQNYIDIYNFDYGTYLSYDTKDSPYTLEEGRNTMIFTEDSNEYNAGLNWVAAKTINIERASTFDISLYLPDKDTSNQAPVAEGIYLSERSQFGRVECKINFYDKDLDYNGARFKFWTNIEGSVDNPNCDTTLSYAFTTNCNLADQRNYYPDRCLATSYNNTSKIFSECGSDNDCWITTNFSKADCVGISGGDVYGYCLGELQDNNGNLTYAQATATITATQYHPFAVCEAFTFVDGKKEYVIFTEEDEGYVECEVGVDEELNPDTNFVVTFEGIELSFDRTKLYPYYLRETHFYREEVTAELEAYARAHSTDDETWEGKILVKITHPIYGSIDAFVPAAITFKGERVEADIGDYTEEDFFELYNWVEGLGRGMLTDPIGTIQTNFFVFLIVVFLIIVLAPLSIMAAIAASRARRPER